MTKIKNHIFPKEAVNWKELESIGIYKEDLDKTGELDTLLNGEKTNPVNLRLMLLGIDIDMDATLQLKQEDENCILEIKGISPEITI